MGKNREERVCKIGLPKWMDINYMNQGSMDDRHNGYYKVCMDMLVGEYAPVNSQEEKDKVELKRFCKD